MKKPTLLQQPPFVIAMPTETVYGLAARIDSPQGIEAIFALKERPFFDPLIVHVASLEQVSEVAEQFTSAARLLAEEFWPGPLTLVLPKKSNLNPMITSGLETVAVRMPRHDLALQLIREENIPLAAPSANKFGRVSPTTAAHVRSEFGDKVSVIDGGACEIGLESTVLRIIEENGFVQLSILRPGAVSQTDISDFLQKKNFKNIQFIAAAAQAMAPGSLQHHYMPKVPLILLQSEVFLDANFFANLRSHFAKLPDQVHGVEMLKPQKFENCLQLSLSENPILAARQLYAELRAISEKKPDLIFFKREEFHNSEAWTSVFDRLTKAASLIV